MSTNSYLLLAINSCSLCYSSSISTSILSYSTLSIFYSFYFLILFFFFLNLYLSLFLAFEVFNTKFSRTKYSIPLMSSSPCIFRKLSFISYRACSFSSGVINSSSSTCVKESSKIARKRLRSIQLPINIQLTKYTAIIA